MIWSSFQALFYGVWFDWKNLIHMMIYSSWLQKKKCQKFGHLSGVDIVGYFSFFYILNLVSLKMISGCEKCKKEYSSNFLMNRADDLKTLCYHFLLVYWSVPKVAKPPFALYRLTRQQSYISSNKLSDGSDTDVRQPDLNIIIFLFHASI